MGPEARVHDDVYGLVCGGGGSWVLDSREK